MSTNRRKDSTHVLFNQLIWVVFYLEQVRKAKSKNLVRSETGQTGWTTPNLLNRFIQRLVDIVIACFCIVVITLSI